MSPKVMISLPNEFLEHIDAVAAEEHRTRSELVREAVRLYIAVRRSPRRPLDDPRVQRAVELQDALATVSPGAGEDSTEEIREWRRTRL